MAMNRGRSEFVQLMISGNDFRSSASSAVIPSTVSIRSFNKKMIVVVHEAIGMAEPVVAFIDVGKDLEKCLAVLVVLENSFFVIAAIGDAIYRAGVFYAERSGLAMRGV